MPDLTVLFRDQPPLHIALFDNETARVWKQLFVQNYTRKFPIFRDMMKYSWEYLEHLIQEANRVCGWDFPSHVRTLDDTLDLHKHIETTLQPGYHTVPQTWHHLLDELHFALHKIQQGDMEYRPHRGWFLQLEWFNSDVEPLPEDFVFTSPSSFGSIRLQNVYVGHTPLMIYQQNDWSKVSQTCRFHDAIKPGLHIMCADPPAGTLEYDPVHYRDTWMQQAPEFVAQHGWDRIMYYTGHPLIGQVINLHALAQVYTCPSVLELQEVIIDPQ